MNGRIEIRLVKLTDGGRLLRLSEKASGLCLEKRLVAQQSVVRQKARLDKAFEELLSHRWRKGIAGPR